MSLTVGGGKSVWVGVVLKMKCGDGSPGKVSNDCFGSMVSGAVMACCSSMLGRQPRIITRSIREAFTSEYLGFRSFVSMPSIRFALMDEIRNKWWCR